jgi:hypothetical protein
MKALLSSHRPHGPYHLCSGPAHRHHTSSPLPYRVESPSGNGPLGGGRGPVHRHQTVKRAPGHWPTLNPVPSSNGGGNDAFLTRLNPTGTALSYSTYLGGSSDDAAQGVALDLAGNAYLAGWTNSTNFPTGPNPYQGSSGGSTDAFLAKVGATPNPPHFTAISPDTGTSSTDQITTARNLTLSGTAAPGATVTVSRAGVGVLGSVTANATTGVWSYDYSGTTLPEGTQAFTATEKPPGARGSVRAAEPIARFGGPTARTERHQQRARSHRPIRGSS